MEGRADSVFSCMVCAWLRVIECSACLRRACSSMMLFSFSSSRRSASARSLTAAESPPLRTSAEVGLVGGALGGAAASLGELASLMSYALKSDCSWRR